MNELNTPGSGHSPGAISHRVTVVLALLGVYLIWGSTYLAIRIALTGYPPFWLATGRFMVAGAALYGIARWRGAASPNRRQWLNCAVTGTLLLGFGNGLVCYAEQSVASGLAAVAVAGMPLFAAVFAGAYGQWPNRVEWLGLVVGFAGVVVLNLGGGLRGSPLGAVALIAAAAAWAFGSVWSRHQSMPSPIMSTAAQMLCGSVVLGIAALASGERLAGTPSLHASLAVGYLVVAGSLLAFSAYIYLLHHVRPALATSYAYVNPPVAVLLGIALAGESASTTEIIGMVVILSGVAAITLARDRRQARRRSPNG